MTNMKDSTYITGMNKLVWQNYWKTLSWKNVRKWRTELMWITLIIFFSHRIRRHLDLEGIEYFYYGIGIALIIFTLFLTIGVELKLPKQMYLVPNTQEERREYMEKLLRLKIAFPNVIMMLVIVGMIVAGVGHWSWGVLLIVQNIATAAGTSLLYKVDLYDGTMEICSECNKIWVDVAMYLGVSMELIILKYFCQNTAIMHKEVWGIFGILLIVQGFSLYKIYFYKNQYFETMSDFENIGINAKAKEIS